MRHECENCWGNLKTILKAKGRVKKPSNLKKPKKSPTQSWELYIGSKVLLHPYPGQKNPKIDTCNFLIAILDVPNDTVKKLPLTTRSSKFQMPQFLWHPGATRDTKGTLVHLALWSRRNVGISLKLIKEMCLKMQQDKVVYMPPD